MEGNMADNNASSAEPVNPDAQSAPEQAERKWAILPEEIKVDVPGNSIRLVRSDKVRAFFIRLDNNPNEGLPKGQHHPIIDMIHDAGAVWRDAPDGKKGWLFEMRKQPDGSYGRYNDGQKRHLIAFIKDTLAPAMGGSTEQGISR
jgi:hypothetical protein